MSTNPRIYLDFNATAPLEKAARDAMQGVPEIGNPSSVHAEGRRMRDQVERARTHVAILLHRPREQVVFTSGGTEANLLGVASLASAAESRGLPRIVVTSPIEHPSLLGAVRMLAHRGWAVRFLSVTETGAMTGEDAIDGSGLVAVAAVNHELGTITDPRIYAAARATGALLHVDAVQAAGKRSLETLDADSMAISAHKIGGPQGVGALALAIDDVALVEAGHQERGRRGGTENTIGIVGFGAAAETIAAGDVDASWRGVETLGDQLERAVAALPGTRIHGLGTPRIGGTINAGFSGARGESIVIALDLAGIAVSTGAACTSGSIQPSAVLVALGQSVDLAREAVRFSLGRSTRQAEIERVAALLPEIVERCRRHR